jgi:hypothetical protein
VIRNRIHVGLLAGVFALPAGVFAQTATTTEGTQPIVDVSRDIGRTRATRNAAVATLRKRVDSVEWNEVSFEFFVEWLREQGEGSMNVVPAWNPLGIAGVEQETLITLSLRNATVAEVLDEAINQISLDGTVRYRAVGNTLRLSTEQDFNRKLYVRTYDVTDLLFRVPDFDDAPEIDLENQQAAGGGAGGAGGTSQPVFSGGGGGGGNDDEDEGEEEIEERMTVIKELIEQVIEPQFWDVNAGPGAIRFYNKMLVIRASIEIHEEIGGYFSFQ